jgi:membrane-bound ClpP family serine protease
MTWPIVLLIAAAAFMMLEVMIPSFGMLGLLSATSRVRGRAARSSRARRTDRRRRDRPPRPSGGVPPRLPAHPQDPLGRKTLLEAPAEDSISRGTRSLHASAGPASPSPTSADGRREIGGVRTDVTAATWIRSEDTRVTVVQVDGTRVVVEPSREGKERPS